MKKTFDQIKKELVRGVRTRRRRTKMPVVVALVGVTGAGNSTIAKALNKILGWTILEKNRIRVKLREEGRGFKPKTTDQIYYEMLGRVMKEQGNAILDSDFAEKGKRRKLGGFVKKYRAAIIYIHLICDRDTMISRMIRANYNPKRDIFKNATIAIREYTRRLPWHYRWSEKDGGSYQPVKLPFKLFAEINTTDSDVWKKKLRFVAKRLRKM